MSQSASSSRTARPGPTPAEPSSAPVADAESPSAAAPPVRDDQPTIISNRPPVARSQSANELARRIAQGQVVPGDRLGHFELLDYVGGGGMGRVLRARDSRLGRIVAMKVLLPEQAADRETLLRFHNEAQSTARLDHPNIVRVFHMGEDQGLHYIAFEFVEGMNVRKLVERKGRLPLGEALSYTLQVAQALEHAAGRQVVHRDIKPSNVLITPEGQVKLIDLGLARLQQDTPDGADLTASGVTLGTFDYISPEQARDPRSADVRSDIYSLGCTFFYMLTGRPPFPEGTVLQKLLQHQGDRPPDVRHFRPELPPRVSRILQKMLAKEPKDRYVGASALVDDLALLAAEIGLRPTRREGKVLLAPPTSTFSFLQRNLPWMVPIVVLLAAVLLLDAYWSWQARNIPPAPPVVAAGELETPSGLTSSPTRSAGQTPSGQPGPVEQPSSGGAPGQQSLPAQPEPESAPASVPAPSGPSAVGAPIAPAGPEAAAAGSPSERLPAERIVGDGLYPAGLSGGLWPSGQWSSAGIEEPITWSIGPSPEAGRVEPKPTPGSPATGRSRVLVVDPAGGENEFATVEAALAAAADGDVIELRFNGARVEKAIHLASRRLTIRAAEGYAPLLVFEPQDPDPVKAPRQMIAASGGRLTLTGVCLELRVPRDTPADQWTLIEATTGQVTRLERCWLSVRNADDQGESYHPDVAFFGVRPEPGAESAGGEAAGGGLASTDIELVDCVARGEAALLRVDQLQPVELIWENGLLATSEQLLVARGGQRSPASAERITIDLRHLTAAVHGGLCRLTDDQLRSHQLPLRLRCADSIVLCDRQPLIYQQGVGSVDALLERIQWDGDRNFYQGVEIFWLAHSLDTSPSQRMMDFFAWQNYWGPQRESLPSLDAAVLAHPPLETRPPHSHTPDDYALDTSRSDNPALGAALDGHDAGFQAERLPPEPAPASATPEQEPRPPSAEVSAPAGDGAGRNGEGA